MFKQKAFFKLFTSFLLIFFLTIGFTYVTQIVDANTFKLEATAGKMLVKLEWSKYSGAEGGYNIYRKIENGSYPTETLNEFPVTGTSYTDEKGLVSNSKYCYKIRPVGSDLKEIKGIETNEACAIPWGNGAPSIVAGKIVIKFKIGEKKYWVDGIEKSMDTAPEIRQGRTFLVIRPLVEAIGGTIAWDDKEQKVTIKYKDKTIELWIGKSNLKVNGIEKPIDSYDPLVKPYIKDGRTMMPLRACGENLGAEDILWDGKENIATLIFTKVSSSVISKGGLIGFNNNFDEMVAIVKDMKSKGSSSLDCVITLILKKYNPYISFDAINFVFIPVINSGINNSPNDDPKNNFNTQTYPVKGKTQDEMYESMTKGAEKNGLGADENGEPFLGAVHAELLGGSYTFRCDPGSEMEEGCKITTTCTPPKLNITLIIPKWDEEDAKSADEETKKCWSDFISALLSHEVGTENVNGHLKIAQKYAKQIEDKGKTYCDKVMSYNGKIVPCEDCPRIAKELDDAFKQLEKDINEIFDNYNKEDDAYEKETDHGRKPKGDQKLPVFPCE